MIIDITKFPDLINIINAALNNGKIIEVKNESRAKDKINIAIVEISRTLKTKKQ